MVRYIQHRDELSPIASSRQVHFTLSGSGLIPSTMKFTAFLASISLAVAVASAADLPVYSRIAKTKIEEIQERLAKAGGCNANICFAIDGSGSMSKKEFSNQKNFVLDVASIVGVDEVAEFAAVQYSTANTAITPLTVDSAHFIEKVLHSNQKKGKSFVTGGINYCFSQLWRRPFDANKIVLLGDGKANVGSSAVRRADLFRKIGGVVAVVSAGKPDEDKLLKIAGGKFDHVFEVTNFFDVLGLQANVEDLVLDICKEY